MKHKQIYETPTMGKQKKHYVSPVSEEMVIRISGILCESFPSSYPSGTKGEQSSYNYYGMDE